MNETIVGWCVKAYSFLLPIAWICVITPVILVDPLAKFRKTRPMAGMVALITSAVIGLTTWFLGAAVTFATWGWIGLVLGLLFFGVGVVPVGILAAFISVGDFRFGLSLIVMVAFTWSARLAAMPWMEDA